MWSPNSSVENALSLSVISLAAVGHDVLEKLHFDVWHNFGDSALPAFQRDL